MFGREGDVVACAGDYTWDQIQGCINPVAEPGSFLRTKTGWNRYTTPTVAEVTAQGGAVANDINVNSHSLLNVDDVRFNNNSGLTSVDTDIKVYMPSDISKPSFKFMDADAVGDKPHLSAPWNYTERVYFTDNIEEDLSNQTYQIERVKSGSADTLNICKPDEDHNPIAEISVAKGWDGLVNGLDIKDVPSDTLDMVLNQDGEWVTVNKVDVMSGSLVEVLEELTSDKYGCQYAYYTNQSKDNELPAGSYLFKYVKLLGGYWIVFAINVGDPQKQYFVQNRTTANFTRLDLGISGSGHVPTLREVLASGNAAGGLIMDMTSSGINNAAYVEIGNGGAIKYRTPNDMQVNLIVPTEHGIDMTGNNLINVSSVELGTDNEVLMQQSGMGDEAKLDFYVQGSKQLSIDMDGVHGNIDPGALNLWQGADATGLSMAAALDKAGQGEYPSGWFNVMISAEENGLPADTYYVKYTAFPGGKFLAEAVSAGMGTSSTPFQRYMVNNTTTPNWVKVN